MMGKTYSGWHVLYVKSRHEKKINFLLKEKEFDTFLPLISTIRQWSDRKRKVQIPLFPCYVFINTNSKFEFFRALDIQGVYKYLGIGREYSQVKDEEIDRIKRFLGIKGLSDIEITTNRYKVGDKVKVNYGQLNNVECEVIKANNLNRIVVRIESIRQTITANIPSAYLSAIKPRDNCLLKKRKKSISLI